MVNNGFLLINKTAGWTSRDICNKVSKIFNIRKVGHIGTLDPFATGLLIVAVGEATKCLPYIPDNKKSYIAKLKLGEKTSSGDITSDIIETSVIPSLTAEEINNVLDTSLIFCDKFFSFLNSNILLFNDLSSIIISLKLNSFFIFCYFIYRLINLTY